MRAAIATTAKPPVVMSEGVIIDVVTVETVVKFEIETLIILVTCVVVMVTFSVTVTLTIIVGEVEVAGYAA